jgi:hypothetical protein
MLLVARETAAGCNIENQLEQIIGERVERRSAVEKTACVEIDPVRLLRRDLRVR